MANSLPWSVKGVDPRTRDAAKAAARRAGMTLGEWLDHKIRDEAEPAAEPSAAPEQLDIAALSERLARLLSHGLAEAGRHQPEPEPARKEVDALAAQAATLERLTQEANSRTAGALDSITRWIEKTEDRLSSSERGAAERQERATGVIAEAIKTMGERIAEIERRSIEARAPRAETPARPGFSRDGMGAAVTDIRTRQRILDDEAEAPHKAAASPERVSALREDLRELGSRFSFAGRAAQPAEARSLEAKIAALSERLDDFDRKDRLESLLKPLSRIETEVARLSQDRAGAGDRRLQNEIAHLAAKVDALAARGSDPAHIAPVLRDIAELRDVVAHNGQAGKLDELAQQVASLGFEVGRLREGQPDMRELRHLSAAIEDVRGAVLSGRASDASSGALASLAHQIEMLAHRFDEVATRQPGTQIEDRIDALQQRIEYLTEQGPSAVTRQIETLADRIESLAASSQLSRMVGKAEAGAPVDTGAIEQMLRHLADKIDEAGAPGARPESFDALEHQIAGIAARLDEAAATRSAENGIERTLQDLVVHLRSMREENAAERAALVKAAGTAAPSSGMTELSDLLADLRDSRVSSERQTQDALGAVHLSLETIMSRLASLEAELQGGEPRAVPLRESAAGSVNVGAPARESTAFAVNIAADDRFSFSAPVRTEPAPAVTDSAFDRPLEPGSGRPRPETPPAAAGQDMQSVRQSLIAAARRSAKAASEAAAAAPSEAMEPAPKGSRKLKDMLEKRKRPLLLSLAALILAMGTAHIVTGTLRKDETRTASSETRSLAAPSASKQEAPAEPAPTAAQASAQPAAQPAAKDPFSAADQPSALSQAPLAAPMSFAPGSALPGPGQLTASPPAAAEPQVEASPAAPEPVQTVTAIGDLPAGLGSAGLRKAALDGDARAVYELASRAADGPAAQRDPKLALRLFERAAVAGLAPAQFRVGNMFEKGIGTQRDLSLARIWYQRAAERGNAKAMHNLAVLHAEGVTGKPDYATATDWFRRAAELGVRDSQYNLAVLLGRGLGTPTDLSQSFLWFAVAAGQGDEDAARKRDEVAQRLKAEELATIRTQAASWKPKTLDAAANEVAAPPRGWDAAPTAAAAKAPKPART
ncbi:hypothetical protein [Bosea thiooxidans]